MSSRVDESDFRKSTLWMALMIGFIVIQPLWSASFHVSPTGHDHNPDGPWATINGALIASRTYAASGPHTIRVEPGEYHIDSPIVLIPQDSGLILCSVEGGPVTIHGGPVIRHWHKHDGPLYAASLLGVKEGTWDFRTLVVNGRSAERARYPAQGTLTHLSRFDVRWMSTTGGGWQRKPTDEELTTMRFKSEDIGPDFEVRNAEVRVYHMWDDSLVGVKSMDRQTHRLTFSSPTGHPSGAFGVHKYEIFNTRQGLTRPGQWMLDRAAGQVVYWPLHEEDMNRVQVVAPRVESIIRVEGTSQDPVKDVTIQGLTLAVTSTPLKAGGFGAGRFDGAVDVTQARGCRLLDLEIVNCGGQGINVRGGGVSIERCHVHHVGACGIRAGGCTVHNNTVDHVGLTYPSAIGVVGGHDTVITHNDIHDTPYSAINCGGRNSRIEANHIYEAMQVLHDGGGIYCFAGKNMVLRGNRIHDIHNTGGYGASAYYLDERSEDCVVEGNLSYSVAWPSHNHMALKNRIRDNVFVYEGDMQLTFPRSTDFLLERNVIVATGCIKFTNVDALTFKNNVLFSGKGVVTGVHLNDYRATGQAAIEFDLSNTMTDPKLLEYKSGRIRFAPDSCVSKLGITSLDVSNAGRLPRP
ncbi:MAG: right-handed parallel beta-helix repeat-containing protein [Planctomycetes bacterium]|nr:right-handed parallel beta-helix repeat-containing protein [Planctomycetota bacterium]